MTLNLAPDWRRTVLALVFAGAGMVLTAVAIWQIWIIWQGDWPAEAWRLRLNIMGTSLYIVLGLLGLVLTGLSMTVALRQVSAKFLGGEVSATGGANDAGSSLQAAAGAIADAGAALKEGAA